MLNIQAGHIVTSKSRPMLSKLFQGYLRGVNPNWSFAEENPDHLVVTIAQRTLCAKKDWPRCRVVRYRKSEGCATP